MLKQELDHIEEIIFAVVACVSTNRPEVTLTYSEQDGKVGISNSARDRAGIDTHKSECLLEIAVPV